ncbi:MAG: porin family protein [Ignavibacteriaceae bacterium]|nr:porin family protein [Ignavibacteriaceae bacterium]
MCSKKIFFVITFLFLSGSFLFPQDALKQGVYSLGGSVSYSYSKNTMQGEITKQSNIIVAPSLNYFLIDNLLVGCNISLNYYELEYSTSPSNKFKNIYRHYGIGPSVRYYFPGNEVVPFVGLSDNYFKEISSKQEGNRISATAGVNYFLTKNVAIEPYLEYSRSSYNKPDQDVNAFSFGLRMNYFIVK